MRVNLRISDLKFGFAETCELLVSPGVVSKAVEGHRTPKRFAHSGRACPIARQRLGVRQSSAAFGGATDSPPTFVKLTRMRSVGTQMGHRADDCLG